MTENPYAPPKARVEQDSTPSARASRLFWVRFYLSPYGRTGRPFFWLFGFLPLALIGLGLGLFMPRTPDGARYVLTVAILLVWPQVVIPVRRLHDLNLSGWWVALIWAIPLALRHTPLPPGTGTSLGFLAAVILGLIPGTNGRNRYGSDPRSKNNPA